MKLTIYMKSGNQIKLRGIKQYTFGTRGDNVTELKLEWRSIPFCKRLLVSTIALDQIEAVTVG